MMDKGFVGLIFSVYNASPSDKVCNGLLSLLANYHFSSC